MLTLLEGANRLSVFSGEESFEYFVSRPSTSPTADWLAILMATSVGFGGLAIVGKALL
ncbi:hypothetical protein [Borborobacter arsenicus]|uniref:hypothetical protein n=1 Tax=Borborobacter arsenicus TaxID=1851146 RepID=UPI00140539D1|nr:hypothetical protein [Pseudaminobacter arsenicus]